MLCACLQTRRGVGVEREREAEVGAGGEEVGGATISKQTEAPDVREGGKVPSFGVPERSSEPGSDVCCQSAMNTHICVASRKLEFDIFILFFFNLTSQKKGGPRNSVAWSIIAPKLGSVFDSFSQL